jgi:DNA polymerase III subunit delta'
MSNAETVRSHILITDEIETAHAELLGQLQGERVVAFIREDFLIEDAKAAIAESYISEAQTKYVVMGAKSFNTVSQNALLKVLEEPPRNIEFILIGPSKSVFLPTIRSRMPIRKKQTKTVHSDVEIRLATLDLAGMFDFVKAHERARKHDAKRIVEGLFRRATVTECLILTQKQLDAFDKAYRLIELNGRFQTILVMLLMTFLPEVRRAD